MHIIFFIRDELDQLFITRVYYYYYYSYLLLLFQRSWFYFMYVSGVWFGIEFEKRSCYACYILRCVCMTLS